MNRPALLTIVLNSFRVSSCLCEKKGKILHKMNPSHVFFGDLLVGVKKFTRKYVFPLEFHFSMLYSNKCDRRPVRLGPLAQLVRAVGS